MKTKAVMVNWGVCAAMLAALLWSQSPVAADAVELDAQARITSVYLEGPEVVVSVRVPPGTRKVTLESRTRLAAGAWVPRAVVRIQDAAEPVVFRLTRSEQLEVLRVRGDATEPLPSAFYAGQTNFNGQTSTSPASPGVPGRMEVGDLAGGGAAPNAEPTREVAESDIWKIRNHTLYFFNQYRGLQIIDLSQPDAPVLRGTLPLAAAGEQMYVLNDQYVLLLARAGCGWTPEQGSQGLVVDVSGPAPAVAATVPIQGEIQESRLVGTALYVASQTYRRVVVPPSSGEGVPSEQWQWGSVVSSFDLSAPLAPKVRDSLWFDGYGNVITATEKFLFAVTQSTENWWQSVIRVVDISALDGSMRAVASLTPAGRVDNKFKMNLQGEVFRVVSENWNWAGNRRVSVLETYSLAEPAAPRKLGQVEVGHGEGLYATRFDGDRAYIVTFLRIDPLWVVDLRDPANPRVTGELQMPGWSTYIHPLGDRLVAVGIDNSNSWRVAVSLFDVQDPTKPGLLAKVPLGENYSWSEANGDEKALTVLPEAGLILVPYQGWSSNNYAARVQLMDLGRDTLAARGVIDHRLQPRRATLHGDRVVSISGRELLCVNAADRDHPVVTAELTLSWGVNRILLRGDYLLELTDSQSWNLQPNPWLRVARVSAPDEAVSQLELTNGLPVIGATVREGRLYVVQGNSGNGWPYWQAEDGGQDPGKTKAPTLFLSVYDLAGLPELQLVGRTEAVTAPLPWSASFTALWPRPGLLVWSGSANYPIFWLGGAGLAVDLMPGRGGWWWPWYGGGSGRLFAFDVADPAAPKYLSEASLAGADTWYGFSEAFDADGKVYLSHQRSEFLEGVTLPGQSPPSPVITSNADGTKVTNIPPIGIWVMRYYLDVVDYADAANPTLRKPVNLPGQLFGVSPEGALLYTSGQHYDASGNSDQAQYIDASAYDGVQAALVASLKLGDSWWGRTAARDGVVFVARGQESLLETWAVATSGQFVRLGSRTLSAAPQGLAFYGGLLAVQANQAIELFDATHPATLDALGGATMQGCFWPQLNLGDGSLDQGLWLPLQDYGVLAVPLAVKP